MGGSDFGLVPSPSRAALSHASFQMRGEFQHTHGPTANLTGVALVQRSSMAGAKHVDEIADGPLRVELSPLLTPDSSMMLLSIFAGLILQEIVQ